MSMKRAVLTVKGRVQKVGYRDFVEEIARKLGIIGFVENLKPYDVKIICEGEEEKIKQFLEKIKTPPKPAEVDDIEVNFEEPKKEFEYFEIKRGDPNEEQGERFDTAIKILSKIDMGVERTIEFQENTIKPLQEKTINLQEKTLTLQEKTLGLQEKTLDSLNEVKTEVIGRFGKFDSNMEKILLEFQKDRKENREFMERVIKLLSEKK